MSKSIEKISVFGEYQKPEDRVTVALLHVINAGGQIVVERLFGDLFDIPSNDINIISQSYHEQSIPDGEISWYCQFAYTYNLLQSSLVQTCIGFQRQISACVSTVGIAQTAFLFSVSHNLFNMLILD